MRTIYTCIFLISFLFACSRVLLPEEQAYLNEVKKASLNFIISDEKAEEAWSRANVFIATYSIQPIFKTNEYIIETKKSFPGINYGYFITRTKSNNMWEFKIECVIDPMFASSMILNGERNAHILAYYIVTGKLPYPNLIKK